MSTTHDLFQQAQLAEAASCDLTNAIGNQINLRNALDLTNGGLFSAAQAADFVAHWQVIDHIPDTSGGFSATLFQSTVTGAYSFAIRGSTKVFDFESA